MKCILCSRDTHAFEHDSWIDRNVCQSCKISIIMTQLILLNKVPKEEEEPTEVRSLAD